MDIIISLIWLVTFRPILPQGIVQVLGMDDNIWEPCNELH